MTMTSVVMGRKRGCFGSLKATAAAVLILAGAASVAVAQRHDNGVDDAFLPSPVRSVSTVPSNGDVNPYGVAFVQDNFQTGTGPLAHGDILVSNYNNALNLQGTGTTIIRIPKAGSTSTFFQGQPGMGLSTALGTLQYGFVLVGNFPTADGTAATAQPGSLLVINNQGKLIQTFAGAEIQGPWDMTLVDHGDRATAYISNALTGTITRLDFAVSSNGLTLRKAQRIASGYLHRPDPAALFVAETGLVYDSRRDTLFVASSGDNAVFAVHDASDRTQDAGPGTIIYQDNVHLHGALAMAMAPNGHLLVTQNDVVNQDPNQPSEIVEFTTNGQFVSEIPADPMLGGSFGLAVNVKGDKATFAAVDDNTAAITIWTLNLE